jgi:hypothetical protein
MPIDKIRQSLIETFTTVFYPMVVFGVFAALGLLLLVITFNGKGAIAFVRRATGALLPFVVLVFLVTTDRRSVDAIAPVLLAAGGLGRFILGAFIGVALMELGKHLLRFDHDGAASLYALFVGIVAAFLVWAMMGGLLEALHPLLAGLVIAGGLHIVFRGPPRLSREGGTAE